MNYRPNVMLRSLMESPTFKLHELLIEEIAKSLLTLRDQKLWTCPL